MKSFKCLLVVLTLAVGNLGMVTAQQDTKDSQSGVQIPDGKPEEMLKAIQQPRRGLTAADIEAIVKGTEKVINHPEATDKQKSEARKWAMQMLYRGAMQYEKQLGGKFEDYTTKVLKEHPNTDAAGFAAAFRWAKTHFKGGDFNDTAVDELWQLAKIYPKNELVGQLFAVAGAQIKDDKKAVVFMEKAIETFGPESEVGQRFKGELSNRKIIGSQMEINGPTMKGESFNIASLKGKVILVDFWATWCGPCVAELPNVKAVYDKYHDKGFEVVAISLDFKREDLEKFVKEKELPWTQLIFSEQKDMGWSNPLARKYGVNGIPAMFLIGRDGKVVARNLRGPALEKAVAEQLEKTIPGQ